MTGTTFSTVSWCGSKPERARADAARALAVHRAAAIEAANAARLSNAADARYRDLDSHAHRVSDFAYFAAQHVSGIILDSQRAAVRSHRAQKAAAAARAAATPRLTPAERRVLTVQRKRRRREEQEADSTVQFLLAKRRLDACPGATDMVARARAAARRCRANVLSLDDRLRATRRSAIVASYLALRRASHAVQEIVLRMRTAARDMRRGVLARRLQAPPPRIGYERRVRIRLAGLTPPRRSRVRQLWLPRTAVLLVPLLYIRGKGGIGLAQMLVRRSPFPHDLPINGLCSHEFFVLARAVSATPPSIVIVALVLGGPERVRARARVVLNCSSAPAHSRFTQSCQDEIFVTYYGDRSKFEDRLVCQSAYTACG